MDDPSRGGAPRPLPRRQVLAGAALLPAAAAAALAGCDGDPGGNADLPQRPNPDQDRAPVRWGFLVDVTRCIGCRACVVACKTANDVRLRVFRTGVRAWDHGEGPDARRDFVPWLCQLCHDPPCIARCPVAPVTRTLRFAGGERISYQARAIYQRPDGLVLVDRERCTGCGRCAHDCPYAMIYLDPVARGVASGTRTVADKCTLCVHRLQAGLAPACVATCPAGARVVGNVNDPDDVLHRRAPEDDAVLLFPEVETGPRCAYVGLDVHAYVNGCDPKLEAQALFPEDWVERPAEDDS